jgi:hypothetical protein
VRKGVVPKQRRRNRRLVRKERRVGRLEWQVWLGTRGIANCQWQIANCVATGQWQIANCVANRQWQMAKYCRRRGWLGSYRRLMAVRMPWSRAWGLGGQPGI